jgi:hypothetical protein
MAEGVMIVELGIRATDGDLLEQMRRMKWTREEGRCDNVVCTIRGFASDPRALYDIAEVRAFCRRLVDLGFISYLDVCTGFNPKVPEIAKHGWGASEVWLCGEGRLAARYRVTPELWDELWQAVLEANERADAALGPLKE